MIYIIPIELTEFASNPPKPLGSICNFSTPGISTETTQKYLVNADVMVKGAGEVYGVAIDLGSVGKRIERRERQIKERKVKWWFIHS